MKNKLIINRIRKNNCPTVYKYNNPNSSSKQIQRMGTKSKWRIMGRIKTNVKINNKQT